MLGFSKHGRGGGIPVPYNFFVLPLKVHGRSHGCFVVEGRGHRSEMRHFRSEKFHVYLTDEWVKVTEFKGLTFHDFGPTRTGSVRHGDHHSRLLRLLTSRVRRLYSRRYVLFSRIGVGHRFIAIVGSPGYCLFVRFVSITRCYHHRKLIA